ncbi:MAG: Rpn family recombination-promoting nuclease/putative transposase [Treponema sp.]|nr:Rpn family recombination-promoting nuclease/putative transposase [Treponema sp.]
MGEKDIAEKSLEAYNDVFSDIVNVLLFDGRSVVQEDDLTDAPVPSQYKADSGKLHEQVRDVAKYWMNDRVRLCLYGLENQTAIDTDIPLRVIGYDGAAYRSQLLDKPSKDRERSPRYPVVTLVLYFGMGRWNRPKSLSECVEIPRELEKWFSDYKVNVFEIAWLSPETVAKFKSDFRIVADYFVQLRTNKDYKPGKDVIRHVHETLQLLSVLANDKRFGLDMDAITEVKEKGGATMCEVLDRIEQRGISIGKQEGISIGERMGEQRGISIGQNRVVELFSRLKEQGRMDDISRALSDREYLEELLRERE